MINDYKEIPIGRAKDLSNWRFGKLTVLYRTEGPSKGTYWLCQCDCGEYCVVSASHLVSNHTTSCGCYKKTARLDDISGQRYGRLTVLSYDRTEGKGHTYWNCKCDCGQEKSIRKDGLLSGAVVSCGCYHNEQIAEQGHKKAKDLTGQIFGRLTALYPTEQRRGSYVVWHCRCSCGNECDVASGDLNGGQKQSCNCYQKEVQSHNGSLHALDLSGRRFGKLVAQESVKSSMSGHKYWLCNCDCGGIKVVRGSHLISGDIRSCGCLHSTGEYNIQKILLENNVPFEKEKTFEDFIYQDSGKKPRYDFYLPDINRLIEFDWEQHYFYSNSGWNTEENYLKVIEKDKIKNNYAVTHNIELVRIPYWERDNITLDMIIGNQYLVKE